jgi:hypothetical protein
MSDYLRPVRYKYNLVRVEIEPGLHITADGVQLALTPRETMAWIKSNHRRGRKIIDFVQLQAHGFFALALPMIILL